MTVYDNWLQKQLDEYWDAKPCKPIQDKDGEYTKCENCSNNCKCKLWKEFFNG